MNLSKVGSGRRLPADLAYGKGPRPESLTTVCGLNLTVRTREKFALHTADQMCSIGHSLELAEGSHCPISGRAFKLAHNIGSLGCVRGTGTSYGLQITNLEK